MWYILCWQSEHPANYVLCAEYHLQWCTDIYAYSTDYVICPPLKEKLRYVKWNIVKEINVKWSEVNFRKSKNWELEITQFISETYRIYHIYLGAHQTLVSHHANLLKIETYWVPKVVSVQRGSTLSTQTKLQHKLLR